jgi:hypothetical protein
MTTYVFEIFFLSAMTPYVDSRDGRSLSIYVEWERIVTLTGAQVD